MAVTVFETAVPFHAAAAAELGVDGAKVVVVDDGGSGGPGGQGAVLLQETDHGGDDDRPERDDVWNMIQSQRPVASPPTPAAAAAPYVHPLVRRSSSLLSQKSLEICTESLGSETGSDGYSDADRSCPVSDSDSDSDSDEAAADQEAVAAARASANPPRAFPPPLPSLARRSTVGGAVQMRQDRRDGRLVVKAVPMPSTILFRAQRSGGRLLLSFADTAAPASDDENQDQEEEPEEKQADEMDDEEEVEVVDRGAIVEVKVSTQPQARSNGNGPRVHRSSLVINKFVNAEPAVAASDDVIVDTVTATAATAPNPPRRPAGSTTTTAAAALVAASALSATLSAPSCGDGESKLLMTACRRRRSKEELMNHMRRCGQLSGKLFIFESRIATSS